MRPAQITPFYICNQLYFECQFDIPENFKPLSAYDGVYDSIQSEFVAHLQNLLPLYSRTAIRALVIANYTLDNIFARETVGQDSAQYEFRFVGVPTSHITPRPEKQFVYSNLKLEYSFQYLLIDVSSHILIVNEPINKYADQITSAAVKLGEDGLLLQHYRAMTDVQHYLKVLMYRMQQAYHFLYLCVIKNNIMTEAILGVFTVLRSGFLRLSHTSFQRFVQYELNYYEFVHYDR